MKMIIQVLVQTVVQMNKLSTKIKDKNKIDSFHFFVQNYKIQNDSQIRTFNEKDGIAS